MTTGANAGTVASGFLSAVTVPVLLTGLFISRLAEGMGFEPTIRYNPYNGLANRQRCACRSREIPRKWRSSAAYRAWKSCNLWAMAAVRSGTNPGTVV